MNEPCPDCGNEMAYVTETECNGFMVANYSECERCGYNEKEELPTPDATQRRRQAMKATVPHD